MVCKYGFMGYIIKSMNMYREHKDSLWSNKNRLNKILGTISAFGRFNDGSNKIFNNVFVDKVRWAAEMIYEINDTDMKQYLENSRIIYNQIIDKMTVNDVNISKKNNELIFSCGNIDPQIMYEFPQMIEKPKGKTIINILCTNNMNGNLQVYFNYGSGLSEDDSVSKEISASNDEISIIMAVVNWNDNKKMTAFRIDPPNESEFCIKNISIIEVL